LKLPLLTEKISITFNARWCGRGAILHGWGVSYNVWAGRTLVRHVVRT
jgi:hypothetical protein